MSSRRPSSASLWKRKPGGLREASFDTGAVKLNYVEGPETGPPLVLMHGICNRWQSFLPLIPPLSMRWRIYAFDFRGHGGSGRTPGAYRGTDYVVDALAFLQNVVKEPSVLYGHSLGGIVSMWMASGMPAKVRALVLGDNVMSVESLLENQHLMKLFHSLRDLLHSGRLLDDLAAALPEIQLPLAGQEAPVRWGQLAGMDGAFFRFLAQGYLQLDPEVLDAILQGGATEGWDADSMLARIKCPVLLLQTNPTLGGGMTDADVRRALTILPRATHVRLHNFGHMLHMERAEPVLRAVTNFLESL
ncbi:MAG: alpha/beta hydrolase [Acidobacteria bacterium]|nr:alpha/beta hydrolase [Acidobacteriota bacterium]